jgi:hypothetical protein
MLAICMINEVDPLAAMRSWVFKLSSKLATKRKVASGHQPGNGRRTDHTAAAERADANEITATKR